MVTDSMKKFGEIPPEGRHIYDLAAGEVGYISQSALNNTSERIIYISSSFSISKTPSNEHKIRIERNEDRQIVVSETGIKNLSLALNFLPWNDDEDEYEKAIITDFNGKISYSYLPETYETPDITQMYRGQFAWIRRFTLTVDENGKVLIDKSYSIQDFEDEKYPIRLYKGDDDNYYIDFDTLKGIHFLKQRLNDKNLFSSHQRVSLVRFNKDKITDEITQLADEFLDPTILELREGDTVYISQNSIVIDKNGNGYIITNKDISYISDADHIVGASMLYEGEIIVDLSKVTRKYPYLTLQEIESLWGNLTPIKFKNSNGSIEKIPESFIDISKGIEEA